MDVAIQQQIFAAFPDARQRAPPAYSSHTLRGHTGRIRCLLLCEEGGSKRGAHVLLSGAEDGTVRVWDTSAPLDKSCTAVLSGHTSWVSCRTSWVESCCLLLHLLR